MGAALPARAVLAAWLGVALVSSYAVGTTISAPRLKVDPRASVEVRKEVFLALASEELAMRKTSAKTFPTDPWSQDDDFHNQEYRRLQQFATDKKVNIASLIYALDEGMREGWPHPRAIRPTVPPCRPRAIY